MPLTREQARRAGMLALSGDDAQRWAIIEGLTRDDVCPACSARLADSDDDARWEWDGVTWWHTCSPGALPCESVDAGSSTMSQQLKKG